MSKLTVIICTYNMGTGSRIDTNSFLVKCLNSYFETNQTSPLLIIVDDGSDDDTDSIIRSHIIRDYPIQKYIRHPVNIGLKASFNEAVSHCETDYFLRVDADIVFTTHGWDTRLVKHMNKYRNCGVAGATQIDHLNRVHSVGDKFYPYYHHLKKRMRTDYAICESVMGCFSCFRMSAWNKVGGITCPQWLRCETEDINLRIRKAGYEIHCLPWEFQHNHGLAKKKTGRYNDIPQQMIDIQIFMKKNHNITFYPTINFNSIKGVI